MVSSVVGRDQLYSSDEDVVNAKSDDCLVVWELFATDGVGSGSSDAALRANEVHRPRLPHKPRRPTKQEIA